MSIYIFLLFLVVVGGLFLLDLRNLFRNEKPSFSNALYWTLIWIGTAMIFSLLIWSSDSFEKFEQFQSAYWIEQSLSIDNLFVFLLIFNFYKVPESQKQKVLLWGVLGAIFLRAIFIFSGIFLVNKTFLPEFSIGSWTFGADPFSDLHMPFGMFRKINILLTIFGTILIFGGIKSFFLKKDSNPQDYESSFGAKLAKKLFPVRMFYVSNRFFIIQNRKRVATLLFVVLCVVETSDLLFAIDSIPAIFSISPNDPFILYSSNIFAVFGLRSMFFVLAKSVDKFGKLKYGVSLILIFVGCKMVIAPIFHISSGYSLLTILSLLIGSLIISILFPSNKN